MCVWCVCVCVCVCVRASACVCRFELNAFSVKCKQKLFLDMHKKCDCAFTPGKNSDIINVMSVTLFQRNRDSAEEKV